MANFYSETQKWCEEHGGVYAPGEFTEAIRNKILDFGFENMEDYFQNKKPTTLSKEPPEPTKTPLLPVKQLSPSNGAVGYMLEQLPEPTHTKPCWVFMDKGTTSIIRSKGKKTQMRGHKFALVEYQWVEGAWWKTDSPERWEASLYDAIKQADWIGKLPKLGRNKK